MSHFKALNCDVQKGIINSFETCIDKCGEREDLCQLVTWLEDYQELTEDITEFSFNQANNFGKNFLTTSYKKNEKTYILTFMDTSGANICKARKII